MPQGENVLGRVNVAAFMRDTARTTSPLSYSQTFLTRRASAAVTRATGYGGIRLIHFQENPTSVLALIVQQGSQGGPTGVKHRLGHIGFRQTRTGHVPDNDQSVVVDQFTAEFVQGIVTTVANLGVNGLHPFLVSGPLGNGQLSLLIPVETTGVQRLAVTRRGRGFQAQIDPDTAGAAAFLRFHRNHDTEIPPTPSVFDKTAGAERVLRQPVAVPDLIVMAVESNLPVMPNSRSGVHRHPAERPANAMRFAPGQPILTELFAASDVFLSNDLNGLAVKPQKFARALGEGVQIVG